MKNSITLLTIAVLLCSCGVIEAETWHLGKGRKWEKISKDAPDRYLLAVAEVKQLIAKGWAQAAQKAAAKLKKDFPDIAGADLDAFIEADLLLAAGRFLQAARSFNKFLDRYPASKLYEPALERQFAIATAFLAGQKIKILKMFRIRAYAEGIKIMEKIADRAGQAPIAKRAMIAVAQSYEKRGKFPEAYQSWSDVSSRWPTGDIGKEALLGMARCMYAAYRGPKYDLTNLISAKGYYQRFRLQYPQDAERIGVEKILQQIEEQTAYKQFAIGQYYEKTGSRQAANLYYQMVKENWPQSTAAKLIDKKQNQKDLEPQQK